MPIFQVDFRFQRMSTRPGKPAHSQHRHRFSTYQRVDQVKRALEVTRIYSIADQLPSVVPLIQQRPFRAPRHTISNAGLFGGGNWPSSGEISLAHGGYFFSANFQNSVPGNLK
jgi:hypothetical protein